MFWGGGRRVTLRRMMMMMRSRVASGILLAFYVRISVGFFGV